MLNDTILMLDNAASSDPTPAGFFRQWEVETPEKFEHQTLELVNYYVWRKDNQVAFLFALELLFAHGETLLLSSGEDSEAISVIKPEALVKMAQKLQNLHGEALIQRISASIQPIWRDVVGTTMLGVRLSPEASNGLYQNDALLFDFGEHQVLLALSEKEGLEVGVYD